MTSHRRLLAATLLLAGSATACTSGVGPSPSAGATGSLAPSVSPAGSSPSPIPSLPTDGLAGQVPESVLVVVREDLSQRLGIDVTNASVVEAQAVTFSDGSLDCPEPGMGYTQALVEGYRLVIELDGRQYDYRVPAQGAPKLCEQAVPGR